MGKTIFKNEKVCFAEEHMEVYQTHQIKVHSVEELFLAFKLRFICVKFGI